LPLDKLPLALASGERTIKENGFSQIKKRNFLLALAQKPLKSCSLHKARSLVDQAKCIQRLTNGMAGYLAKAIFLKSHFPLAKASGNLSPELYPICSNLVCLDLEPRNNAHTGKSNICQQLHRGPGADASLYLVPLKERGRKVGKPKAPRTCISSFYDVNRGYDGEESGKSLTPM
jgi:hypothetical protein